MKKTLCLVVISTLTSLFSLPAKSSTEDFDNVVTTYAVAHMATGARVKQIACSLQQDRWLHFINEALEERVDTSGKTLSKQIIKEISDNLKTLKKYAMPLSNVNSVGFPIKHHKTILQLEMALKWMKKKQENFITNLAQNSLYNGLSSNGFEDELPILQAPSKKFFWGNENPSVSSVLLYSVANSLEIELPQNLTGMATFYPFFKEDFSIDCPQNPFLSESGMLLFGDYQYGAHRYFSNPYPNLGQLVFGPEDCSSAVGKATGLTEIQIVGITTRALRESYGSKNQYGYSPVTSSLDHGGINLELINPGDIYVRAGHTAIVASKNNFNIQTLGFHRDIDTLNNKVLGGGMYQYDLTSKELLKSPIYILRQETPQIFGEEIHLRDFVHNVVDTNYLRHIGDSAPDEIRGDCSMFLVPPEEDEEPN